MPSSRKRNKGKDRRAKKAAEMEECKKMEMYSIWTRWTRGNIGPVAGVIQCNHGLELELENVTIPDISHPVSRLITSVFMNEDLKDKVWNDGSYRELAVDILTSIGASWMLRSSIADDPHSVPIRIAQVIVMLENYTGDFDSLSWCRTAAIKCSYFHCGNVSINRDLLKFFHKRVSCKCLRKMHSEARKTHPKLGLCFHCNQMNERELLMVCSRCMVTHYCSRKCQIAASPNHRLHCDNYVRAHQQTVANDTSYSIIPS